jgi:hypothetical protein
MPVISSEVSPGPSFAAPAPSLLDLANVDAVESMATTPEFFSDVGLDPGCQANAGRAGPVQARTRRVPAVVLDRGRHLPAGRLPRPRGTRAGRAAPTSRPNSSTPFPLPDSIR